MALHKHFISCSAGLISSGSDMVTAIGHKILKGKQLNQKAPTKTAEPLRENYGMKFGKEGTERTKYSE